MKQKTKKNVLLLAFLCLILLSFFPALGIAGNENTLVFGIPLTIVWISIVLVLLVLLSIISYKFLFAEWATKIDSKL